VPYWDVDTGMAALLMLLKAVDEGLGACLFGIEPDHIAGFREAFGVPEEYMPVCVVSFGYAAPSPKSASLKRGHRPAAEVVHHGRW
jgi:nitroreductase